MKVVHLINTFDLGGAEATLRKLLFDMDRERFAQAAIVLIDPGPFGEGVAQTGVPVYTLNMQPSRPSLAALWQLMRLLRQEQPDVLQTWLYHADLMGLLAARIARVPIVVWNIRNSKMDTSQYHQLTTWTIRACAWLSRQPRAVVVNSAAGRQAHAEIGYRPREWVVIPNGIDTDIFRPDPAARLAVRQSLGVASDAPLIGLIARFDPQKDHMTFLRAAGLLSRRHPQARFLLAGNDISPDNEALAQAIEREGLASQVHLLGARQDVPHLYAALDIATLSSRFGEGFPNVVGEAMACGVPCAVTDVGDAAAIVGDTGCVVPPGNPEALASAWEELMALGPAGRQALGQQARQRIEHHFQLADMVRQYERLYERLTTRRSGEP